MSHTLLSTSIAQPADHRIDLDQCDCAPILLAFSQQVSVVGEIASLGRVWNAVFQCAADASCHTHREPFARSPRDAIPPPECQRHLRRQVAKRVLLYPNLDAETRGQRR
jgi:hypothetical protein